MQYGAVDQPHTVRPEFPVLVFMLKIVDPKATVMNTLGKGIFYEA
jgi:hypothetical protein